MFVRRTNPFLVIAVYLIFLIPLGIVVQKAYDKIKDHQDSKQGEALWKVERSIDHAREAVSAKRSMEIAQKDLDSLSVYRCTKHRMSAILDCADTFRKVARVAERSDNYALLVSESDRLIQSLRKTQVKLLPKMRDAFGYAVRNQDWKMSSYDRDPSLAACDDIQVQTIGDDYQTLEIWGSCLTQSSEATQSIYQQLENRGVFWALRFQTARAYRNTPSKTNHYTRFRIDPPEDHVLMTWDSGEPSRRRTFR